jgi:hypothetical protein
VDEKGRPREDAAPSRRIIGEPGLQQTFITRVGEELDITKFPVEQLFQFYRPDELAAAEQADESEGAENGAEDGDSELVSLNEVEDGDEGSHRRSRKKDKKHKKDKKQKKRDKKSRKSRSGRSSRNQEETPTDGAESASSIEISNEEPVQASNGDVDESEDVELEEIPRKRSSTVEADDEEEEDAEEAPAIFPVVILIEPLLPASSASAAVMPGFTVSAATRRVQGLATYATLIKTSESYEIKTLRQKLFFDGLPCTEHRRCICSCFCFSIAFPSRRGS